MNGIVLQIESISHQRQDKSMMHESNKQLQHSFSSLKKHSSWTNQAINIQNLLKYIEKTALQIIILLFFRHRYQFYIHHQCIQQNQIKMKATIIALCAIFLLLANVGCQIVPNIKSQDSPKFIYIRKWLTSNGAQPTLFFNEGLDRSIVNWNSQGFAPAWINLQFRTQYVQSLGLTVAMFPKTGNVTYTVTVDGWSKQFAQPLTTGTQKTIPIGRVCSSINITTTATPSWVAWDDMFITA